jgi:ABC-type nickel/cobalt efflux system permease component RcnA
LILKKALSLIAAIAAMAAAAAVCVVAAAFALYALVRYYVGPAAAAASVAVVAAILAAVLAFVCFRKVKPRPEKREDQSVANRLIDLAREKPIIAAGAAAAAGLVLLRNPGVIGAAISAAMANRAREADRREKRGRRW